MPKRVVFNCIIVVMVFSVIAPFFTMATFVPKEGEIVYDLNDVDNDKLKKMTPEEANKYLNNEVKTRKLSGFERITYLFIHPSIGFLYLKAAILMFVPFFLATIITSYLNIKIKSNALK